MTGKLIDTFRKFGLPDQGEGDAAPCHQAMTANRPRIISGYASNGKVLLDDTGNQNNEIRELLEINMPDRKGSDKTPKLHIINGATQKENVCG